MQTLNLYERLSHKYRDGWRHLDNEIFVATVKATPPKWVEEGNSIDDGGAYIMHVRAPSGAPDLRKPLRDTLSDSGCRHDFDCCGCQSTSASVRKISARDYLVKVLVRFNY